MITLNDYLYSGDTIFRILRNYTNDLRTDAKKTGNAIDQIHCNFLIQIRELWIQRLPDGTVSDNPGILQIYGEKISSSGFYI